MSASSTSASPTSTSTSTLSPTSPSHPSLSSLPPSALLPLLERACEEFDTTTSSTAAEAFLIAFQSSSHPLPHCHHILTHSSNARAHYTALSTLKAALLREWALLSSAVRAESRDVLFAFVTRRMDGPAHAVAQAVHALVLVVKRQWVDDRAEAWSYIEGRIRHLLTAPASQAAASLSAQLLVLRLLQALLSEFSVWHTTPLHVSVEAHLRCHLSFEQVALFPLFSLCLSLLLSAVTSWGAGSGGSEVQLLQQSVRGIELVLSWEFHINFTQTLQALSSSTADEASVSSSSIVIEPPAEWRQHLTQSGLVSHLLFASQAALHPAAATATTAAAAASAAAAAATSLPTLNSVLRCLLQLASLRGPVFTPAILPAHTRSLITACSSLLQEKQMQGEIISGVTAVLCRLWDVHGLRVLVSSDFAPWLQCLVELTGRIVHSRPFSSFSFTSDTSTTLAEALDQLLGTWASLVVSTDEQERSTDEEVQHAHRSIEEASEKVLWLYVERRLQRRKMRGREERAEQEGEGIEDEGESEEDEQFAGEDNEQLHLTHLAFLARVHPQRTLIALRSALSQLITDYAVGAAAAQSSTSDVGHTLAEQLLLLFRLLQGALTDESEDEVPPLLVKGLSSAAQRLSMQATVAEVVRFLSLLSREVDAGRSSSLSPLLTTCALQAISRILSVYLLCASSPSSPTGYLDLDFAIPLATSLCTSSITFLLSWPGEAELHSASLRLLSLLCQHHATAPAMVSSPAYQHLLRLFVQSAALSPIPSSPSDSPSSSLDSLDGASLISLTRLLLSNSTNAASRVAVLTSIYRRLLAVLSLPYFASHAGYRADPRLLVHLTSTLRMLLGVVDATKDVRFDELFSFLSSLYPELLSLLELHLPHSAASSLVLSILDLFSATASQQMSFMDRRQTALFLCTVTRLIHLWLSAWQVRSASLSSPSSSPSSSSSSSSLPRQRVEMDLAVDAYEAEVSAILSLLSEVVDEDLQSAGPDTVLRAGDVCLLALTTLTTDRHFMQALPHLHADVSVSFYHLVMETLTTHTQRFGELLREAKDGIIRTVLAQVLEPVKPEVQRFALSTVQAIAAFHCQHAGKGGELAEMFGPYLPQCVRSLLRVVLYQHLSPAVVDSLADALLPCLIAASSTYADISRSVIEQYRAELEQRGGGGGEGVELDRLQRGFHDLCVGHGVQQSLSMSNKLRFRKNVKLFIETVRVIVQYK